MIRKLWPISLCTPHLPLDMPIEGAFEEIQLYGDIVEEVEKGEGCFRNGGDRFGVSVYEADGFLIASWYNDPSGRWSRAGRKRKVGLYLARYIVRGRWEERESNPWMRYFWNEVDGVQCVYGIDKDVLRFNRLSAR